MSKPTRSASRPTSPASSRRSTSTKNQQVKQGQVLFRLDDLPFRLALDRANAQLGIVRNDLNALKANYQTCRRRSSRRRPISPITIANSIASRISRPRTSRRSRPSTPRGGICRPPTEARLADQQLAAIAANSTAIPISPVEQHPLYLSQAQRDDAQRELDHTVVKAPFDGIVTNVDALQVGKYLQASKTAFSLVASRPRLGRRQPEGNRTDLCAARPAGHDHCRHLSGRRMERHRREHQPGFGAGSRCCRRRTPPATG